MSDGGERRTREGRIHVAGEIYLRREDCVVCFELDIERLEQPGRQHRIADDITYPGTR
jgi:hypothetical protein